MIIVIDDERTFEYQGDVEVIYCRSSSEGISALCRVWANQWLRGGSAIDELWLDHDLGVDDTIMTVVEWLDLMSMHPSNILINKIYVHTMNPAGADSVLSRLGDKYPFVIRTALPELRD